MARDHEVIQTIVLEGFSEGFLRRCSTSCAFKEGKRGGPFRQTQIIPVLKRSSPQYISCFFSSIPENWNSHRQKWLHFKRRNNSTPLFYSSVVTFQERDRFTLMISFPQGCHNGLTGWFSWRYERDSFVELSFPGAYPKRLRMVQMELGLRPIHEGPNPFSSSPEGPSSHIGNNFGSNYSQNYSKSPSGRPLSSMRFHVIDLLLIKTGAGIQPNLSPNNSSGRLLKCNRKLWKLSMCPSASFSQTRKGETKGRVFRGRGTFIKNLWPAAS